MPKVKTETKKQLRERADYWRAFRREHMMTQAVFAGLVGISRRSVQQIEGEERTPGFTVLSRFRALEKKYKAEGK